MNDVVVLPVVMQGKGERYLATDDLFKLWGGVGGLVLGDMGIVPVTLEKGKGAAARDAAIELVSTGKPVVMFPEGYSFCDGSMGVMKKGAVLINSEAAKRMGTTSWLVPAYLRYGKYPGHWIRRVPIQLQYVLCILLSPLYRRGCTVVIGDPIPSDKLPADENGDIAERATYMLRCEICKLDPAGLADPDAPPASH
jgi:1-acyl-sn-glycerol-3-phosphate acyltransferase